VAYVTPVVQEFWSVIDRWWTLEPTQTEFMDVAWGERRVIMVKRPGDFVWRVHGPLL
jgi:hypothetical protein